MEYAYLWNDLPSEERQRLMPYAIESQILHMEQVKQVVIRNHKKQLAEINDWQNNLKRELQKRT
jgi:cell division protein FtsX